MRRSTRVRSSGKSPSLARGPTRGGTSRRGAGFSEVTGVRIAQVSPWFSPHFGGVESHVRSRSRELARRGHEVTVVTSQHDRTLSAEETVDGFRVIRVRPRFIFMQTPITPRMRGSLRALSADVVHAHSPPPLASHYAGAVASERGIPYVVTYHCDVELPSAFGSVVESIYRRSLGADTLRNANQVIVTTRTYAATSRAIWRYNPSVIPNAVDHRRFRPDVDGSAVRAKLRIPPEVPIVLLVGRIVPHKGVEHFVEAARYVPDARFLVAGGGSGRTPRGSREPKGPRGEDPTAPLGSQGAPDDGRTGSGKGPRVLQHRAGDGPHRGGVPGDSRRFRGNYGTTLSGVLTPLFVQAAQVSSLYGYPTIRWMPPNLLNKARSSSEGSNTPLGWEWTVPTTAKSVGSVWS